MENDVAKSWPTTKVLTPSCPEETVTKLLPSSRMLNGTAVELAVGAEAEEVFWTVALLAISDERTVTSLAEDETEVDSVWESLMAVELDSLDRVDDDSVEV